MDASLDSGTVTRGMLCCWVLLSSNPICNFDSTGRKGRLRLLASELGTVRATQQIRQLRNISDLEHYLV